MDGQRKPREVEQRSPIIGSPWNGSMAGHGIKGLYTGGVGEANGSGCDDVKLGRKAAADTGPKGFEVDNKDGEIIGSIF